MGREGRRDKIKLKEYAQMSRADRRRKTERKDGRGGESRRRARKDAERGRQKRTRNEDGRGEIQRRRAET